MPARRDVLARRPVTALAGAGLLALAGGVLLASCASPASSGATSSDGISIVATTTQVADFTRELAGERASLTQLVQPDQSAHSFDPSAAQLLALGEADALVVNGAGLESWIDDAIDASGFDGILVDASTGIEFEATGEHGEPAQTGGVGTDDGQGGDADDVTRQLPDTPRPPSADPDEGHEHGEGNPHIWTSPENAAQMVRTIAAGLEQVPGADAAEIDGNEQRYLAKLEALDGWIRQSVDQVPAAERLLVTNHDAFTYFVDEYGIDFVGSVIPSFDDNAEPSAAQIDELVTRIRATGVRAVFSEASISPKAAETIAREAGVQVYSGPDSLYGDSLGAVDSDGATYLASQIHNVRLILESWGAEPLPLPPALQE